ncbi:hypothetical protein GCM10020370_41720 [Paenibacillus hodogayensis]
MNNRFDTLETKVALAQQDIAYVKRKMSVIEQTASASELQSPSSSCTAKCRSMTPTLN